MPENASTGEGQTEKDASPHYPTRTFRQGTTGFVLCARIYQLEAQVARAHALADEWAQAGAEVEAAMLRDALLIRDSERFVTPHELVE